MNMANVENAEGKPKQHARRSPPSARSGEPDTPAFLVFTLDASSGDIVRVDGLDQAGASQELSTEDKLQLARQNGHALNNLIEQAFEAGVACVLGSPGDDNDSPESEDEARVLHLLLQPLIDESATKGLINRAVPGRVVLDMLIQNAASSGSPDAGAISS